MRRTPEEMAQSALETAKRKRARAVERVGRADAELRTSRKALLPPEQPVIGLRAVFDWAEHLRTELARLWEGTDATPAKPGEVATDAQALHAMLYAEVVDGALNAAAERDALAAKVERARALHFGEYVEDEDRNRCFECGDDWPCPTVRALDEEPQP